MIKTHNDLNKLASGTIFDLASNADISMFEMYELGEGDSKPDLIACLSAIKKGSFASLDDINIFLRKILTNELRCQKSASDSFYLFGRFMVNTVRINDFLRKGTTEMTLPVKACLEKYNIWSGEYGYTKINDHNLKWYNKTSLHPVDLSKDFRDHLGKKYTLLGDSTIHGHVEVRDEQSGKTKLVSKEIFLRNYLVKL